MANQKLELNWIGKNKEYKLEPRILIENPEYSTSSSSGNTEEHPTASPLGTEGNLLIHGDNLLALKALEQDYAGKVKCIYIDPPYNTGAAFEHYDDNLEHSTWLNLMYQRLKILHTLLAKDGIIWVHLDDLEVHYCKVIMDEIFGRSNFISSIAIKSSTPSGVKTAHRNKTIIKQKDLVLLYRKSDLLRINPIYIKREKWDSHYSLYKEYSNENGYYLRNLTDVLLEKGVINEKISIKSINMDDKDFKKFYIQNAKKICRLQSHKNADAEIFSKNNKDKVVSFPSKDGNKEDFYYNGQVVTPLTQSLQEVVNNRDISNDIGMLLCDFWSDIDFQNTQNEGGIEFPASKKPEALIYRVLKMCTNPGDLVLDSFLGSGTTAAVAHKMGRRWIGIELGEHAITHCVPRLRKVVSGEDQGGISKAVGWKGGGGFRFYNLAPSLLEKDHHGQWVISPEYNATMLAAAVAKHEGFRYQPDESLFWKQSQSSENDYLLVTTQFLSRSYVENILETMQPHESLLICCTGFDTAAQSATSRITLKKIPKMLEHRCEFGRNDYSFNIVNLPFDAEERAAFQPDVSDDEVTITTPKAAKKEEAQQKLF